MVKVIAWYLRKTKLPPPFCSTVKSILFSPLILDTPQNIFSELSPYCMLISLEGPLGLGKKGLCVCARLSAGRLGCTQVLINNWRALLNGKGIELDINSHTVPWPKKWKALHMCRHWLNMPQKYLHSQTVHISIIHKNKPSPSDCKCTVCHYSLGTFFISSPHWCVTVEIRQWWQRCQRRGGGKGGLKLNRKLCTSIKTRGGDIKSYTPAPGDRMHEGGEAMESDSSIRVGKEGCGGKEGRETGQLCLIMY